MTKLNNKQREMLRLISQVPDAMVYGLGPAEMARALELRGLVSHVGGVWVLSMGTLAVRPRYAITDQGKEALKQ